MDFYKKPQYAYQSGTTEVQIDILTAQKKNKKTMFLMHSSLSGIWVINLIMNSILTNWFTAGCNLLCTLIWGWMARSSYRDFKDVSLELNEKVMAKNIVELKAKQEKEEVESLDFFRMEPLSKEKEIGATKSFKGTTLYE